MVSEDPAGLAALPTPDLLAVVHGNRQGAGVCLAECGDLRSVELFMAYEPGAYIELISPTPLLMVVALGDHLTVADEALGAYERARQPKRLVTLKGGHFDAYVADFDAASGAARDWFVEHPSLEGSGAGSGTVQPARAPPARSRSGRESRTSVRGGDAGDAGRIERRRHPHTSPPTTSRPVSPRSTTWLSRIDRPPGSGTPVPGASVGSRPSTS